MGLAAVAVAGGLVAQPPTPALAEVPLTVAPAPPITTYTLAAGAGNQTDPHIGGNFVSYTNVEGTNSEIRYHDLTTGADAAIPNEGHRDELSDISGSTVVFRRIFTDGSTSTRPVLAFDTATGGPAVELDPSPGARRGFAAIGAGTVAWVEFAGPSSNESNVVRYERATGVATPLTSDGLSNRTPAVSPDGSAVTWAKCQSTGSDCDVYVTLDGSPIQLTDSLGADVQPDTNGERVFYASNAAGDFDIWWENLDGTGERQLVLGDVEGTTETNPNVSGNLVLFEREVPGSTAADLWLYHLTTRTLYQLTSTPGVDEVLSDISVAPDGTIWVVWAQADRLTLGHNDVMAMSFRLDPNRAPDCAGVVPSAARLWPADLRFEPVGLSGASDPDGDPVTLGVTAVTQDEPVNDVGDGNTAPDAQLGPDPHTVGLRAERSGTGDGRVYRLAFTASDPAGASCSGQVTVGVPLVRNGHAVDSGGSYDSLVP